MFWKSGASYDSSASPGPAKVWYFQRKRAIGERDDRTVARRIERADENFEGSLGSGVR